MNTAPHVWLLQVVETAEGAYALVDRGGLVALLLLGIIALFMAFQFGWIVPRWMFKRQEQQLEESVAITKGFIDAIKQLTEELREQRIEETRSIRRRTR